MYPLLARKGNAAGLGAVRLGVAGHGLAWQGMAGQGKEHSMPKRRQPKEVWSITRARIWARDDGRCVHCSLVVALDACHIDHIRSGKLGTNEDNNLRVLCRRCHVLRADMRHRGMIAAAIRDGIIPPDWRALVWED